MSNYDLCAECYKPVRPRQEGLQCDGCLTWQHRTCKTGISQREYREAVKSGQVQNIGLAQAYIHDNATHKLCRQFLALPYLPKEHIPVMFENLASKASTPKLAELATYIRTNWIEGKYCTTK